MDIVLHVIGSGMIGAVVYWLIKDAVETGVRKAIGNDVSRIADALESRHNHHSDYSEPPV